LSDIQTAGLQKMRREGGESVRTTSSILKRVAGIALFFVALALLVTIVGESMRMSDERALPPRGADAPALLAEGGMYDVIPAAMLNAPRFPGASERSLDSFYARRAYPGAPPTIPHAAGREDLMGDNCLGCHAKGGYVPAMKTYAPITPHPQMTNCRQCHVIADPKKPLFKPTDWEKPAAPARQLRAMVTSPLVMPHDFQMRESCNACHSGEGAVKEIRGTHPERTNCRQCHVPGEPATDTFERPAVEGADYAPN
jgi:nitrate reductase (cytochrome), electron transfer subunit